MIFYLFKLQVTSWHLYHRNALQTIVQIKAQVHNNNMKTVFSLDIYACLICTHVSTTCHGFSIISVSYVLLTNLHFKGWTLFHYIVDTFRQKHLILIMIILIISVNYCYETKHSLCCDIFLLDVATCAKNIHHIRGIFSKQ